jgi:hypothetical protein
MKSRSIILSLFILILVCLPADSQLTADFHWVEKRLVQKLPKSCSVNFKYPQFTVKISKAADARTASINKKIFNIAKDEANKFESELDTLESSNTEWTGGELTDEYRIYLRNNCLVSLSFYIEKYIEPSAHPSHSTLTVNYEFYSAKNLELKDLFKKDSNYLDVLSKLCYDYLVATLQNADKKLITKGTEPIASNFKNFYLTPDSLNIVFDEYSVDCYAGGAHTVPIQYSSIKSLINPKSPVNYYAAMQ